MKEITNGPLDPAMIPKYPDVRNHAGNWATAVWDKHTEMWYVQSFLSPYSCIINAAQYREKRFGNMYMYECRWKDKWMLVGMLDNCDYREITSSHPPASTRKKKSAA